MLWVVRYPLNGGSDWDLRPRKSVPFPLIEVSHRRGSTACCLQHCWSCNFAELLPHMNPVYGLVHHWVFCITVVMHTADRNNLKVSSPHGDPNFSSVPYLWNVNTVLSSLSLTWLAFLTSASSQGFHILSSSLHLQYYMTKTKSYLAVNDTRQEVQKGIYSNAVTCFQCTSFSDETEESTIKIPKLLRIKTLYTLTSIRKFSILFCAHFLWLERRICLTVKSPFRWWSFPLFLQP